MKIFLYHCGVRGTRAAHAAGDSGDANPSLRLSVFRHEGDCATVCTLCDRIHLPNAGCSKRPRSYFTAALRSRALFEHSIDVNDSIARQAVVQLVLGAMEVRGFIASAVMADGDHRASMQAYEGNQRALCLHCRAVHRVALSCACFRFGFRHEGDFALLLLNCPIVTTTGSPSAPAKLALAARASTCAQASQ